MLSQLVSPEETSFPISIPLKDVQVSSRQHAASSVSRLACSSILVLFSHPPVPAENRLDPAFHGIQQDRLAARLTTFFRSQTPVDGVKTSCALGIPTTFHPGGGIARGVLDPL
jgi:hypothetical protein